MDEDDRCEQCGSTVLEVEDDGRTYCENGHDQGRAPVTADDDLDFARQGKVIRKKERKEKQKISGVLHGIKAYQLFLQSWQLILRKQCYALVHQKGLPPELWTIVRDLWVLWLSKLDQRLQEPNETQSLSEVASETDPATTSANETDTDPETEEGRQRTRKERNSSPTLVDTIVLNYLGILLLRRPIGLGTILKWIQQEDIPFIRAIRHVPAEMKNRLPGEYHLSLDTMRILESDDLQAAVYRRAKMFSTSFGMILPSLNRNLFLLNCVRSLSLPIEVYSIAQRLNTITDYRFCYPDPATMRSMRRQPTTYPEAQVISLIVVATKLLFPFDSNAVKRYPKDPNGPTNLRMDWSAWLNAKRNHDSTHPEGTSDRDGLDPGTEINVTDSDILNMTDRQLDQYMDWYQRTWIDSNNPGQQSQSQSQENALDREILDLFPLHELPEPTRTRKAHEQAVREAEDQTTARIQKVQSSLMSCRAISPEEEAERGIQVLRPGAMYLQLRNLDDLAKADEAVKVFHKEAAQMACMSVKALLRAVGHCEEKIERWLKDRRREEVFEHENQHQHASSDAEEEEGQETEPAQQTTSGQEYGGRSVPMQLATSPPIASASGVLAGDLSGLDIQSSPGPIEASVDEDREMEM